MMSTPLDTATEARLVHAAERLGEMPDTLAARAVGSYLEDLEDYARAAEAWAELKHDDVISLDDMGTSLAWRIEPARLPGARLRNATAKLRGGLSPMSRQLLPPVTPRPWKALTGKLADFWR